MLNQQSITFPVHQSTLPTLATLLGQPIAYVNARPYQRTPLLAIGIVIGWQQYHGLLLLKVQNTTTCRERWITAEYDFLGLVQPEGSEIDFEVTLETDPEYLEWLYQTEAAEITLELAD